jgi:hypothetical protein
VPAQEVDDCRGYGETGKNRPVRNEDEIVEPIIILLVQMSEIRRCPMIESFCGADYDADGQVCA